MEETTPKKEEKELSPEREKPVEQMTEELAAEKKVELGEKEISAEQEKIVREELEKKISAAKLTPELEEEAKTEAEDMKEMGEEGKLARLLKIAEEKDVTFAFGVAKDMNDHYILDKFHDLVIEKGLHKKLGE